MGGVFVGRDRELGELCDALAAAVRGRGGLYLLSGEPGIGKTRLVTELADRAGTEGAHVVWGWCTDGDGAPPLWPWVQVIRTSLRSRHDAIALLGPAERYLALLVPDELPVVERAEPDDPDVRFQLYDSVSDWLQRLAEAQPLVVILEDLHNADPGSLQLLEFVARAVHAARVLVVGTYRAEDLAARPEVAGPLAKAARHGERLPVGELNEDATRQLVADRAASSPSDALLRQVHDAAGGNPLFISEYVRLLAAEGLLEHGRLPGHVPEGVRDTIARRISTMAGDTVALLRLAAVLGREFLVGPLADAAGVTRAEALAALGEAAARGIVVEGAFAPGTYAFSHDLMREALYHDLSPDLRAQLHLRSSQALERWYGDRWARHASELAHHVSNAGEAGRTPRGARYLAAAAGQAQERFAFAEAASLFARAADLLDGGHDAAERARLLIAAAENRRRVMDTLGAAALARQAADAARRAGDPELLAAAVLVFGVEGCQREDVDLIGEALNGLPEDHPDRALVLATLANITGRASTMNGDADVERARALLREAVSLARASGDPGRLAQVLITRHYILEDPRWQDERLETSAAALDAARAGGRLDVRADATAFRIMDLIRAGELTEARDLMPDYEVLQEELRRPLFTWGRHTLLSTIALCEARLGESDAHITAARHAVGRIAHRSAGVMILAHDIELAALRGWPAELVERVSALDERGDYGTYVTCLKLQMALARRDLTGARPLYDRLWAVVERDGVDWTGVRSFQDTRPWARPLVLGTLADGCYLLADVERATTLSEALTPLARYQLTGGRSVQPPRGLGSYHLGSLATLLTRYDEAEAHFLETLAFYRRMGSPPWLVRTQQRFVDLLRRRDHPGDRARATTFAADAEATIRTLGLHGLASTTDRHPPPPPEAPAVVTATLRRDGDVWTVAHAGRGAVLRDTKGLKGVSILVQHPGREFHVVELTALLVGVTPTTAPVRPEGLASGGEAADALLDPQAKAAYRRRIGELCEELDEAERFADGERVARARAELDALTDELAHAVGLGGRDRMAATNAERARINITRNLRYAIDKIASDLPALGRHLQRSIRTGTFCSYEPDPDHPVSWQL